MLTRAIALAAALSISRALREAAEAVKAGEKDGAALQKRVVGAIEAAGGRVDYVEVSLGLSLCRRQGIAA